MSPSNKEGLTSHITPSLSSAGQQVELGGFVTLVLWVGDHSQPPNCPWQWCLEDVQRALSLFHAIHAI